jgi:hypothetical protein
VLETQKSTGLELEAGLNQQRKQMVCDLQQIDRKLEEVQKIKVMEAELAAAYDRCLD